MRTKLTGQDKLQQEFAGRPPIDVVVPRDAVQDHG
jgi:hypothetical protein